ncbi:hypothetical protein ACWZHB_32965 [Nocardia sp. FBN12]|uniref:hypothetical protein n=1 Tax=Nocardia sp. FBN12 TaxID=3419766 RepID=UPI003D051EE0
MGTTVSGGIVVNQAAMTQSVNSLKTTVSEVRGTAKVVDANSWGDGMNGADYEAGRAYLDQGKRIAEGLDRTVTWLKVWTTAVEATAEAVGKATVEFTAVDAQNARALNQVVAK